METRIELVEGVSPQRVSPGISIGRALAWDAHRCCVQVVGDGSRSLDALSLRRNRIASYIRSIVQQRADGSGRGDRVDQVYWLPAGRCVYCRELPAPKRRLGQPRRARAKVAAFAEGKVIDHRKRVVQRLIVSRFAALAIQVGQVHAGVVVVWRVKVAGRVVDGTRVGEGVQQVQPV